MPTVRSSDSSLILVVKATPLHRIANSGRRQPSPIQRAAWSPMPWTHADIEEIIQAYAAGASRLQAAGFDGVEVYLAHGYLLCEFLSRFSNTRTDVYGGSLENRCRLPLQVLQAVRAEVGDEFAMGIRVSADEFVPEGLEPSECVDIVSHLTGRVSIDYLSVSQSNYASIDRMIPDMSYPRAPFAHYAKEIRQVADGIPVFAVGRLVTPEQCEDLLVGEAADLVCLVRPLIADAEFANKARDGRRGELRECISCNVGCRGGPHRSAPIACLVNPAVGYEEEWGLGSFNLATEPKDVLIVGGGPAGLKAAETAALRGHRVTLHEATEQLGGQVLTAAAAMPYRDEFANSVRFLARRIQELGVIVHLNTRTDAATLRSQAEDSALDVVLIATGSTPGRPAIPGADLDHVVTAHEAILSGVQGPGVTVLDSGEADWKCLTTAENLAAAGHRVSIVTPVGIGAELDAFSKPPLLRRLRTNGVEFIEYHAATAIEPNRIRVREGLTGNERWLEEIDTVVTAWYGIAETSLLDTLRAVDGLIVHGIGDCLAPRRAIDAIWDGFRVAVGI